MNAAASFRSVSTDGAARSEQARWGAIPVIATNGSSQPVLGYFRFTLAIRSAMSSENAPAQKSASS